MCAAGEEVFEINELNDLLTRLKAALNPTMEAVPD